MKCWAESQIKKKRMVAVGRSDYPGPTKEHSRENKGKFAKHDLKNQINCLLRCHYYTNCGLDFVLNLCC